MLSIENIMSIKNHYFYPKLFFYHSSNKLLVELKIGLFIKKRFKQNLMRTFQTNEA